MAVFIGHCGCHSSLSEEENLRLTPACVGGKRPVETVSTIT
jgi:hypothetical protein